MVCLQGDRRLTEQTFSVKGLEGGEVAVEEGSSLENLDAEGAHGVWAVSETCVHSFDRCFESVAGCRRGVGG